MSSIIFTHLEFHYDTPHTPVFHELSLLIDTHWKSALVGRNGRGKTTLLKLLMGQLAPSQGQLTMPVTAAYFPHTPKNPEADAFAVAKEAVAPFRQWEIQMQQLLDKADDASLTAYGTLLEQYEAAGGYEIDAALEKELVGIGIGPELFTRPFQQLSGGEQTRVLIAALFLRKGQYPLIDEPTNHLDMAGREQLAEYLHGKAGFLMASHDRFLLDACVDHVVSIEKNTIRVTQGNYSQWRARVEQEDALEARQQENLQREIKSLQKAAQQRRHHSASKEKEKSQALDSGFIGHRSAKLMQRALNIERRIENNLAEKQQLLRNRDKTRALKITPSQQATEQVLTVNNLRVVLGGKSRVDNVSLTLEKHARIAVIGPNGCGKTTLLNALNGDIEIAGGSIDKPSYLKFARSQQIPQWSTGLLREHLETTELDETHFRRVLGEFNVSGEIFERPLETFSQGELKKVDLCRSIALSPDVLLWDEPMNYIDIDSREQIEQALLTYQPTLLFVEHDRYFVERVATQVIELAGPVF